MDPARSSSLDTGGAPSPSCQRTAPTTQRRPALPHAPTRPRPSVSQGREATVLPEKMRYSRPSPALVHEFYT